MPVVKLSQASYKWALKHLLLEGDTDLFPRPFEIDVLRFNWTDVLQSLAKLDLNSHDWNPGRRVVVPKSQLGFRAATQLDPLDALIFTALIKTYGRKLEASRLATHENRVYSYRFDPQPDGRLYGLHTAWQSFWEVSRLKAMGRRNGFIAIADISDYYNQIYHHVLANELLVAGIPASVVEIVEKRFLSTLSQGVSRGIPVGPHAVHLLAECALNPIDRSLLAKGQDFCRYVDDYHFFCDSREMAEMSVFAFAETLDTQHRLQPQQSKVRICSSEEFVEQANAMLVNQPVNEYERDLLEIIASKTSGNPYQSVGIAKLNEAEQRLLDQQFLEEVMKEYLGMNIVPFTRVGWLLRRLSQVGLPGAVDFCLKHVAEMSPVLGDVARYVMNAAENYKGDLKEIGSSISSAMVQPVISQSEYVRMVLVHMLAEVPGLNHLDSVTANYGAYSPSIRRETVLAASAANRGYWLKERKDEFATADPWLRRAILAGIATLPGDEGEHWLKKLRNHLSGMEKLVVRWSFKNRALKVGDVKLFN